jgi:hypothetical protein
MINLKVAVIFIIAILATSVLGIAALYGSVLNFQGTTTNSLDNAAALSENDTVVDATIDDIGNDSITDISTIDIPTNNSTNNTSANTSANNIAISFSEPRKSNSIVTSSKIAINNPINSAQKIIYGGTSPQCKTIDTNTGNSTSNNTLVNNGDFVRPSLSQLVSFLANDNTDSLALPDNTAVVQLAKNACTNKYHNQIVLLVFSNGQVYAVNRFQLNDGTFAYVDSAQLTGIPNGTQNMDRLLSVHRSLPVTATSPYQATAVYNYPTVNMMYGIPMWSI